MAPALRKSTRDKTEASAEAASRAGFVRRSGTPRATRAPVPRNKRYARTKGLVSLEKTKGLQHITIANANSPLLRLPPEIRNIIFEHATRKPLRVELYFIRLSRCSISGYSSHSHKTLPRHIGLKLPQVCRQVYAETAILVYRVNRFSFVTKQSLTKWLSKRLPAQREAIEHLELFEGNIEDIDKGKTVFQELKETSCPNLRSLTQDKATMNKVRLRQQRAMWRWERGDDGFISGDDEETWVEMMYDWF
ncbi:hypothetical protein EKO04_002325 [Ascochyta lentis]|uniref:DUF7730 domain-containing protein n=1 Tax=Ascochyta lentis TaxID=205686 RepID=A0A8H7MLK7_9PLEO|nr:hypothetical protein EKO04_002325 [Ascochyta lentis]